MKLNSKAFSAVEALLIVVIVAIVGGTGYYVYHANKTANKTLSTAAKDASGSPKFSSKKKTVSSSQSTAKTTSKTTAPATQTTSGHLVEGGTIRWDNYKQDISVGLRNFPQGFRDYITSKFDGTSTTAPTRCDTETGITVNYLQDGKYFVLQISDIVGTQYRGQCSASTYLMAYDNGTVTKIARAEKLAVDPNAPPSFRCTLLQQYAIASQVAGYCVTDDNQYVAR